MSPLRILVAGTLDHNGTAYHRMEALRRLGYEVVPFDFSPYWAGSGKLGNWLYHRALFGPAVSRLNRDLRRAAEAGRPNFILIDKGIFVTAQTVSHLSRSVAPTIQYNLDNPFGSMGEPSWRLLIEAIPYYDIHFVPREINIRDYRAAGAKQVIRVPLAYEPTVHFPPPDSWGEADRPIDVSYTGAPYDDRSDFLTGLLTQYGIATDIRGNRWDRALKPDVTHRLYKGPSIYGDAYRRRFWESKICLAFVTHGNRDRMAHKSFEIAGAGGFLMAEATEEHLAAFEDGKEAVFFSDLADCARLIRKYLPDPESRERIAKAGHSRAVESGYSNDARLKRAFETVEALFPR